MERIAKELLETAEGCLGIAQDCHGLLRTTINRLGLPRHAMDCSGLLRSAKDCYGMVGLLWIGMDCCGLTRITKDCEGLRRTAEDRID